MSSLFAALNSASGALNVLGQGIGVVQNNVANASTPGFVTQTLTLNANPFDPVGGLSGGVSAGTIQSSRNVYAEQAVWSANEQAGSSSQQSSSLNSLQSVFDVSGTSGISSSLSSLYSSFSAWSTNPTDTTARQQVLVAAGSLTQSFNQAATSVQTQRAQTDQQLTGTVTQINQLTGQIATLNGQIKDGGQQDAGIATQLYNTIEQLSNLAPITVQTASDGTASVLLGGQSPLVLGQTQTNLHLSYASSSAPAYPGATPNAQLQDANGQDVTRLATQGQLGALLNFRNVTIPAVIGNEQQQGSLNQLAQGMADRVNTVLTSGQVSAGPPAVAGNPLFSYSPATATSAASTLSLDSGISAANLAAISPGPPVVANGVATQLSQLGTSQNAADQIGGLTYTAFYSGIAAGVGQQAATASTNETTQAQVLAQAQNMRAQVSGVSLNQQASLLMEYQQGYQAAAQVISTINTTVQSLLTTMQQLH